MQNKVDQNSGRFVEDQVTAKIVSDHVFFLRILTDIIKAVIWKVSVFVRLSKRPVFFGRMSAKKYSAFYY